MKIHTTFVELFFMNVVFHEPGLKTLVQAHESQHP